MQKKDILLIVASIAIATVTGISTYAGLNSVLLFVLSAASLVMVAMIVGKTTEQLGNRLGPAATGV